MASFLLENSSCAYAIPNRFISVIGCKTNIASNTACRGFGVPQVYFATQVMPLNSVILQHQPYNTQHYFPVCLSISNITQVNIDQTALMSSAIVQSRLK